MRSATRYQLPAPAVFTSTFSCQSSPDWLVLAFYPYCLGIHHTTTKKKSKIQPLAQQIWRDINTSLAQLLITSSPCSRENSSSPSKLWCIHVANIMIFHMQKKKAGNDLKCYKLPQNRFSADTPFSLKCSPCSFWNIHCPNDFFRLCSCTQRLVPPIRKEAIPRELLWEKPIGFKKARKNVSFSSSVPKVDFNLYFHMWNSYCYPCVYYWKNKSLISYFSRAVMWVFLSVIFLISCTSICPCNIAELELLEFTWTSIL